MDYVHTSVESAGDGVFRQYGAVWEPGVRDHYRGLVNEVSDAKGRRGAASREGKMQLPYISRLIAAVAGVVIYVASVPAVAGERVALGDANLMLLQGRWEGDYVSRDTQGKVRWQSTVTLDVPEQSPRIEEGRFSLKKNGKWWATKIKIQDGDAMMSFGFKERAFVREQDGDAYTLKTNYRSKFEGYPRKNTVHMKRQ